MNTDKVSFGITAFDRYTGSTNRNGIFKAIVFDNEIPVVGFQMDSISYDETRYLNAHIDYKLRNNGGPFVQHLSKLPGYNNGIYKTITGDGVIEINDDKIHTIRIEVSDAYGNSTYINVNIKHSGMFSNKIQSASPAMSMQNEFHAGFINIFENENVSLVLPENSLYDSFRFQYKEIIPATGNIIYQLHNNTVPLHDYFSVKIKNNIPILLKNKVVIAHSWKAKTDFAKADLVRVSNEDWYKSKFREFGNFQLQIDTIAPIIIPLYLKEGMNCNKLNSLAFMISDNSEILKNFTATLDGKWLRFSNDKGRTFIYQFDEMCRPGQHELIISVEDIVGNRTEKTYHFTR